MTSHVRQMMVVQVKCACMLTVMTGSASHAAEIRFYVSPSGNDTWTGKAAERRGADGPFATMERARNAVREVKGAGKQGGPVTVFLRGGVYELSEPVVFTPEDSGTDQAPVTWAAYPGEKPVVSGGRRITGFRKGENGVWMVSLPEVKERK